MDKTIDSIEEKVDYYLHKIAMAPTLRLDPRDLYEVGVMDEEMYLVDQVMLEKGLIKIEKENRVITSKGLEISNFGGWTIYQKLMKRDRAPFVPKEDAAAIRYEEEILRLKQRVAEAEKESQLWQQKEADAFRIINKLTSQVKTDKVLFLLTGLVTGFILAVVLSMIF